MKRPDGGNRAGFPSQVQKGQKHVSVICQPQCDDLHAPTPHRGSTGNDDEVWWKVPVIAPALVTDMVNGEPAESD